MLLLALVAGTEGCGSSGDGSGNGGSGPGTTNGSTGGGGSTSSSGAGSGGGSGSSGGSGGSSSSGSSSGSGGGSGGGSGSGSGSSGSGSGSGSGGVTYTCAPGLPSSIADLQPSVDSSSSTKSKSTPMGTHFEGPAQHAVTSAERALLSDATQQPDTVFSGAQWQKLKVTLYPAPNGKPEPADINQHSIGNCDGDSALASLVYQNPDFVQSRITDNKDGTYTVKMFDPMGKPMTVNVDSQFMVDSGGTNIGQVSCKSNTACWSTVLEKAYIKYNQVYGVVSNVNGIGSEHTTPMFTGVGDSFAFNSGALSPADMTRAVTAFLAAGKFITTGFNVEGVVLPAGGTPSGAQSVTAHGYAAPSPRAARS